MLATTVAAGEKYVRVPLKTHGYCHVTIGDGTVASFIDCSALDIAHHDAINVRRLDLSRKGHEFVEFTFDGYAFNYNDLDT